MTRRNLKFTASSAVVSSRDHHQVTVDVEDVDVTDFLDAEMAVDELDHRDLLNAMDAGDVADWLRGEGYHVEEEE